MPLYFTFLECHLIPNILCAFSSKSQSKRSMKRLSHYENEEFRKELPLKTEKLKDTTPISAIIDKICVSGLLNPHNQLCFLDYHTFNSIECSLRYLIDSSPRTTDRDFSKDE
mmetsp:Transcript_9669/g.20052  ORF Transcript_9669/g.20052 Transcript_9669/m.20052 type:complete len:112 (-) Transcript_9669:28-363(-)